MKKHRTARTPKRRQTRPPPQPPPEPPIDKSRTYTNRLPPGKTPATATAELVVEGTVMNARTAIAHAMYDAADLDLTEYVHALRAAAARVQAGDLSDPEGMLVAQAATLNTMFTKLLMQTSHMTLVDQIERFTRLAFKAQSQCRATLETLAVITNPPVFARQANIANGPQQVNNQVTVEATALPHVRAGQLESARTKLLEAGDARMDAETTGGASEGDQAVAPVGVVNRTQKR